MKRREFIRNTSMAGAELISYAPLANVEITYICDVEDGVSWRP